MINVTQTTANNINYIAVNVGPNRDNYAIEYHFKHDLITDVISYKYHLIKNWIHPVKKKGVIPKEGAKFRERIATDNYHKLIDILKEIVSKEGMEIDDPKVSFAKTITHTLK